MSIQEWDARYRAGEQRFREPSPLVIRFAAGLAAGRVLDLASGPGRNALYLAQHGWRVTAVDGSPVALQILSERAAESGLEIDVKMADLGGGPDFQIEAGAYDLVCDCYFLERNLFPRIKSSVRPGGRAIVIVHLADPGEKEGTARRAVSGELKSYFADWNILHYYEGPSREPCHARPVAELVAAKPEKNDQDHSV